MADYFIDEDFGRERQHQRGQLVHYHQNEAERNNAAPRVDHLANVRPDHPQLLNGTAFIRWLAGFSRAPAHATAAVATTERYRTTVPVSQTH